MACNLIVRRQGHKVWTIFAWTLTKFHRDLKTNSKYFVKYVKIGRFSEEIPFFKINVAIKIQFPGLFF